MSTPASFHDDSTWFAHGESAVIWAAIQALPEEQLQLLHDEMARRLAYPDDRDGPERQKVARVIAAVREAQQVHEAMTGDERLTSYAYERLQDERPEQDWPPARTVARHLGVGSWTEVLHRCHLPEAPEGEEMEHSGNYSYSAQEVVAALQECAKDLGRVPSWWGYICWSRRVDVKRRPGRRPRSQSVFERLWPEGGYYAALQAAGLAEGTDDVTTRPGGRVNAHGQVVPAGYRYAPATVRAAMRACAEDVQGTPTVSQYTAWRLDQLEADRKHGRALRAIPSVSSFLLRFNTWNEAIADAGLEARSWTTSPLGRGRPPIRREEMQQAMQEALEAKGEPLTKKAYEQWRSERHEAGDTRHLPNVSTICKRFGGWMPAHAQLLGQVRYWHSGRHKPAQ